MSISRVHLAFFVAVAGCDGHLGSDHQALSGPALTVVSVDVPPRAHLAGSLAVRITVTNSGSTTWKTGSVKLAWSGDSGWSNVTLFLPANTKSNAIVIFTGTLG